MKLTLIPILLIVLGILAIAALGFALFYLVKANNRKQMGQRVVIDSAKEASGKARTCAGCGELRIIVRDDESLCAFCYSSKLTKKS